MSRSRKKHPFGSWCTNDTDKPFKQWVHSLERRTVRQLLHIDPSREIVPQRHDFADVEDFGKGTTRYLPKWYLKPNDPRPDLLKKDLRK